MYSIGIFLKIGVDLNWLHVPFNHTNLYVKRVKASIFKRFVRNSVVVIPSNMFSVYEVTRFTSKVKIALLKLAPAHATLYH